MEQKVAGLIIQFKGVQLCHVNISWSISHCKIDRYNHAKYAQFLIIIEYVNIILTTIPTYFIQCFHVFLYIKSSFFITLANGRFFYNVTTVTFFMSKCIQMG